jgi:hypothetical protein
MKQSREAKLPEAKLDKSLNQLSEKVLFPMKLEQANRVLGSSKLPKH